MESHRHNQSSSYQSLSLEDHGGLLSREPLSDAAGNAQLHSLAVAYHDYKGPQPQVDRPMYSIPTVPSQPPQQYPLGSTLEPRRQSTRRRRHHRSSDHRYSRNPIVDSPQYQAYRARQSRDGNQEDAKWPMLLEIAFLDALVEIPCMGRRKFSYNGKPHGRNELIKEYLWIAYTQSLAPGQRPDYSMQRSRKQVSSHIQVLKGFLRDHPAFERLFPSSKGAKNGFEDSFKNDPCLIALSQGRLPTRRYERFENLNLITVNHRSSTRPAIFWLLITSPHVPTHGNSAYTSERDLEEKPFVIHRFSELSSQSRRENLDVISNWRQKFPHLEPLYNSGELTCDIIHMDVSLELMGKHAPEGAELIACAEMSISGRDLEICEWQTVTSLIQPSELYRDPRYDVPLDGQRTNSHVLSVNDHEARIKVSFPAAIWTHSLTCLTDLQLRYNKAQMSQVGEISDTSTIPATEFVDQISMYQEVQSCSGHGLPFVRRAIILWTFHACTRSGNGGQTTWRHIDPAPSRRSCMSPSPHPSHLISAVMNENFNTWIDNPTTHIQNPNMLNQFVQGLATPPHTGGLRSPFASNGYGCHDQQFDMPPENLSFESATATIDSESTLVDSDTAANIDSFLSNSNVHIIIDYDNPAANWNVGQSESFDADPAWANYPAVPSSTPNIEWDGVKSHAWPDLSEPKHGGWVEEVEVEGKHAWADSSPAKPEHAYMDQIVDKLLPWIEQEDATTKDVYAEVDDVQLPELSAGIVDTKEQSWVDSGSGFDYSQLIERLKS